MSYFELGGGRAAVGAPLHVFSHISIGMKINALFRGTTYRFLPLSLLHGTSGVNNGDIANIAQRISMKIIYKFVETTQMKTSHTFKWKV